MIQEVILKITNEYKKALTENFVDHPLAKYIRSDVPDIFREMFPDQGDIEWDASPGQGRWADAPWIAAFDPLVTESAQEGYYPVYLFTRSLNGVYLSMNQGMQAIREEFGGPGGIEVLQHRARIIRSRLSPEYQERFNMDPIDLQPKGPSTRLAFYEPGHAFGIRYDRESIPNNDQLLADLAEMLSLYRLLTIRGGTLEFDQPLMVSEESPEYIADLTLEEKRKIRLHCTIERNQRLVDLTKKYQGYDCKVCKFNFLELYGELGRGYIEAHHLTPISQLSPEKPVRLSPVNDFVVVCSNCHRMIHRSGAPDTFDGFLYYFTSLDK